MTPKELDAWNAIVADNLMPNHSELQRKRKPGELIENRVTPEQHYATMEADLQRLCEIEIQRELDAILDGS